MYKIVLGMSYYIHADGLGALVDGVRPDSEGVARAAGHPLLTFTPSRVRTRCVWRVRYAHAGSARGLGSVAPIPRRHRVTPLAVWPPPNVNQVT